MTVATFPSKEWAMIGVLGERDGLNSCMIPERHRAILDSTCAVQEAAWNQRIADAGRKTQNYDKGLERFVRKYDPDQEMETVIALAKGVHRDHGLAIYATQEKRRCFVLGTIHGHTDEEALWYALMWWAFLQPRKKRPRQHPGQVFYPAEQSHLFEKYWNHLENLQGSTSLILHLVYRLRPSRRILRLSRMRQSVDYVRSRTILTYGKCTGVVRLQCQAFQRSAGTYTMLLPSRKGSSFHEEIRLGTTLYQQCRAYETVRVRRTCPPPAGESDGADGTLRGSPV
jgi:hypothetical protein